MAGMAEAYDKLYADFPLSGVIAVPLQKKPLSLHESHKEEGNDHECYQSIVVEFSRCADFHGQQFARRRRATDDVAHCRGLKLIDIDAGMYRASGGNRVYLEIGPDWEIAQHAKQRAGWERTVLGS